MSSHQLNSNNNKPVLLFKTIKALKVFPVVYYRKKKKPSNFTATARPWRNFFFDVSFFITPQEQFVEADNWPKTAISLKNNPFKRLRCFEHVFYHGSVNSKRARPPPPPTPWRERHGFLPRLFRSLKLPLPLKRPVLKFPICRVVGSSGGVFVIKGLPSLAAYLSLLNFTFSGTYKEQNLWQIKN